jgi:hypothetical protein
LTRKLSELKRAVKGERRGKGRDAHYVAECPLCGYSHSVDMLSSEKSAELLAKQHILHHLKTQHAHEIDPHA